MLKPMLLATSCIALSACSTTQNHPTEATTSAHVSQQTVESFYDYQLYSPSGTKLELTDLPSEITQADVVLVGEWHTHSAVHRFQTDLLKQLSLSAPNTALSMEQFSRDKQQILDSYLSGDIGEQTLIKQANAWPNYESDYRPLVELAKTRKLDIIAANAPKPIVRCIGREGLTYLDKLDSTTREQIARSIDLSSSPYKDKFMASVHHGTPEQTNKQYAAQVTWDETMAESIVDYLAENSATKVLHIAGKFHIEEGLGTKAAILKRNPNLKVVVITPSSEPSIHSGNDYLLHVLSPPARYVQKANRMHAYKALGKRNDQLTCE